MRRGFVNEGRTAVHLNEESPGVARRMELRNLRDIVVRLGGIYFVGGRFAAASGRAGAVEFSAISAVLDFLKMRAKGWGFFCLSDAVFARTSAGATGSG